MKIKVMITDDQRLMREGLKTILDLVPDMMVAELAENGRDALDKIPDAMPDVILMDIRMPLMDGVECTKIIKQRYPDIKVLILTTFDDDELIIEALKNGASGYILKDLSSIKLITAIRDAYQGHSILQPEIAAKLISHITGSSSETAQISSVPETKPVMEVDPEKETNPAVEPKPVSEPRPASDLTDREKDVLRLVGEGMTNAEISKKLFISEGTVKNYISNLYSKLNMTDRSKLTVYAIENKYL